MTDQQPGNIIDDIIDDHREFEQLFAQIKSGDPRTRSEVVEHVIAEIVRHAIAEEQYIYPVAREVLPNGDELVEHEIAEHSEAEEVMKEIEKTDTNDPKYGELVEEFIADIRHHIEDEESKLLPQLRDACPRERLQELSETFQRAKNLAPTRPHPLAPDRPPANRILGPGAGLVDRVRDALSGRNA